MIPEDRFTHPKSRTYRQLLLVLVICAVGLALRLPFIGTGLPFLYEEDEGHHYNRVVNMVKSGDFNPHYFHKPSLHFYLRMPVVAAGFLWSVRKGYLRSLKDIKTANRFGLAGYAFTASHPGLVKWARAESVLFSILLIIVVFFLTLEVTASETAAAAAAALCAVSPPLVGNAAIVGVDTLMALLCAATVLCACILSRRFSYPLLLLTGLLAGLSVSTKYNALPIVVIPLLACLLSRQRSAGALVIAVLAPAAGFMLGTPYALASLPLFLDQLAYEIWHYGVEGHVGHQAEPGLPQLWFYLQWLYRDALGLLFTAAAAAGLIALLSERRSTVYVALTFPLLFLLLMVSQKANFTRNMLPLLPFAALAGGSLLGLLAQKHRLANVLILICCLQPFIMSLRAGTAAAFTDDSRLAADAWLGAQPGGTRTAVSGQLQFPSGTYTRADAGIIDEQEPLSKLAEAGFQRFVLRASRALTAEELALVELEQSFSGERSPQRIVKNPAIDVYRLKQRGPGKAS